MKINLTTERQSTREDLNKLFSFPLVLRCSVVNKKTNYQRGAAMLEFAFVFPVMFFFILLALDISHYYAVDAALDEAVHRAADRSSTVPNLDVNPGVTDPPGSYGYERLVLARQLAIQDGISFLLGTGLVHITMPDETDEDLMNTSRAVRVNYNESFASAAPTPNNLPPDNAVTFTRNANRVVIESPIMVLLPGNCGQFKEDLTWYCNRETLGLPADGSAQVFPAPEYLLERHPIKAVAYARLDGYTPFFNNLQIVAEAYAYRQPVPQGPFPAGTDPAPASELVPSAPALPPSLAADSDMPLSEATLPICPPACLVTNSFPGVAPQCPESDSDGRAACS